MLERKHFDVASDPGIAISVREIRSAPAMGPAVLMIHGARTPSGPSYDLPIEGGSLAGDLARRGLQCFLMDARGYGRSTRLPEMEGTCREGTPLVRADEVFRDIHAVAEELGRRASAPILFGWATGALWAGHFASIHSAKLSGLILYNPIYGGIDGHALWGKGSALEDPAHPGHFNRARFGAYRLCAGSDLLASWNDNFAGGDPDEARDPRVAHAFVAEALASDPRSAEHAPPAFRAPSGAVEDTFYAMRGRQLYDATLVRTPTLIIQCEKDWLARATEIALLQSHLVGAPRVEVLRIAGATHYAHLERPDRGRDLMIDAIVRFAQSLAS